MIAAGVETWNAAPPITYRDEVQPSPRSSFPAVQVHRWRIQSAPAVLLGSAIPETGELREYEGLRLQPLTSLIADLARTTHPIAAYANISTLFSHATGFANREQETGRQRADALRSDLLSEYEPLEGSRGISIVRALTKAADPGIGSVWEGGFLWMLHCWLKPSVDWASQYGVTFDGRTYFCDAAVPALKLSLEFDGSAKLGTNERDWRIRSQEFLLRAQAFSRHGWTTVRVTAFQFNNVEAALFTVGADLQPFGVAKQCPGGPLWKPLSGRSTRGL